VDSGQPITQVEESLELEDADLFVTRFAPDGCLQWYPAIRRPLTEMDFLRIAYRAMWLDYLGAQRDKAVERQSVGELLRCYDMPVADALAVWRKEHGDAFDAFAEMAQRGIRDTEKLLESFEKGGAMRKAQQQVRRLMELDEEMRLFSELHHACKPLTRIARFERDNLEGADPRKLAQTTQQIYRDAFARARLARKKLANVAEVCETVARERR
ncbi:MAG: hypothetical protein QG656_1237, partial [Candidatus Hydrogenedentes bacterium]|nr:hypothetical protein [Candidatus Hydrogenedentota bacterium]